MFVFPYRIILAIHFILLQKDLKFSERNKKLKLICFIILYLNIALNLYWVFSVQSQINKGYAIADEIEEYYEINKNYPESINSILANFKIDTNYNQKIQKIYSYDKSENNNSYLFVIHPKEIKWIYFQYNNKSKKFDLIDD